METKAISTLSVYIYFADISIVNSGVCEAYAHVYQIVIILCDCLSLNIKKLTSADSVYQSVVFIVFKPRSKRYDSIPPRAISKKMVCMVTRDELIFSQIITTTKFS